MNASNDIKFQVPTSDASNAVVGSGSLQGQSATNPADALTLIQLEQLLGSFESVDNNPASQKTKKKAQDTDEELLQSVVDALKSALSKGLKTNPKQVQALVAKTANALSQYTATNPKAMGFVVAEMGIAINNFLLENPEDHSKVAFAFSPLIALCGQNVEPRLAQANVAILNFQAAFAKADPATAKPELEALLGKLVGNGSGQVFGSILDSIKGELNSLDASDTEKYSSLVQSLYTILSLTTLSNPETAEQTSQVLLSGGFISAVYQLDKPQMDSLLQSVALVMKEMTNPDSTSVECAWTNLQNNFNGMNVLINDATIITCGVDVVANINRFLNAHQSQQNQNTPNLSTLLGMAMLCFQEFQQAVAQSQANQDQSMIAIGQATINSATTLQTQLDAQISKEAEEIAKANQHPWYSFLIEAVVALIAVIVSAVTAGVGAAIAAAMVSAFMMSPLGSEVQTDIAEKIAGGSEQDLYNKYISEGMSPQDAQAKAAAEWNKAMGFAGLIMIVATIIVTAGVGGIGGAGEAAGQGASEAVADAAAEESSTLSKLASYSLNQGLKVGLTQGLGMTATLDPMLNFLLSDQSIANNSKLVQALAGTLEVVMAVLTIAAGYYSAQTSPQTLAKMFSSLVMPLVVTNGLVGMGSSAYSLYSGIEQSGYLKETASVEELIGELNKQSTLYQGELQMNEQTNTNTNTADQNLTSSIGADMTAIENMASQLVPVGG